MIACQIITSSEYKWNSPIPSFQYPSVHFTPLPLGEGPGEGPLLTVLLIILYQLRHYLFNGTIDDIVGNGIDGSVGVVVDGDDDAAVLHTGNVLDLAGDAAGDVHFRVNGDTGLSDLAVMVSLACIHGGTAGTYFSMEFLCQLEEQVETFL